MFFKKGDLVTLNRPAFEVNLLSASIHVTQHRQILCKFSYNDIGLVVDTLMSDIKILSSSGVGWCWDGAFEHIGKK